MKLRLYDHNNPIWFGGDLSIRLPKKLSPGPPDFCWLRLRFQKELFGTPQYVTDGGLAVSRDPNGPVTPVRVILESPGPLIIRKSALNLVTTCEYLKVAAHSW